jgi:hypothetical protein
MTTHATKFRAGKEPIECKIASAVPFGFVFQLPEHLSPRSIADRLSETMILEQIRSTQSFNKDRLVFADRLGCELTIMRTTTQNVLGMIAVPAKCLVTLWVIVFHKPFIKPMTTADSLPVRITVAVDVVYGKKNFLRLVAANTLAPVVFDYKLTKPITSLTLPANAILAGTLFGQDITATDNALSFRPESLPFLFALFVEFRKTILT